MDWIKVLFSKWGIAALLLLTTAAGFSLIRPNAPETGDKRVEIHAAEDITLEDLEIHGALFQAHHDFTTLSDILNQQELLAQMEEWRGKALIVKIDETSSPANFHYYYYKSLYQDSNLNSLQDPADLGFFNPASTVKVALAALVLEQLADKDLTRQTEYRVVGTNRWHRFDDDIRRTLVISDNEATNRLILWLGFDSILSSLKEKGLSDLSIHRLMLNKGTLIPSPAFEMREKNKITQQDKKAVTTEPVCYEIADKIGNCATATTLLHILMQMNQPEYFRADQKFSIASADREWLQSIMSHTPQAEGFDYPDDYCRFLTELEQQLASNQGKMLSKCGVALFTNTYADISYLETDTGQKYYIFISMSPPRQLAESRIIQQINRVATALIADVE